METVIKRIMRGQWWKFHGGIHPPEQKFLTKDKPIRTTPLPEQLILPLQQHIGLAGDLLVKVGDSVLKGQPLTLPSTPMSVPVHAPTSGTITEIKNSVIAHPSGVSALCLFILPDGADQWVKRTICENYHQLSKADIIDKIIHAGIAGMGGAGFPTHIKVGTSEKLNYLIINAAECEPYITADDLLIREHSPTIIDGIKILDHLLNPKHILIGIEDNKPEAIKVLQQATADCENMHVCVVPTKYPSGGEKQLIQLLTGQEVPKGVLPNSLGIVLQNIATCFAIADAVINDTPLIKRVVTVSGQGLEKPQNLWALLGTPVSHLLTHCGFYDADDEKNQQEQTHVQIQRKKHLIMGGPMMGFSLFSDQTPVVKTTNCILAPDEREISSSTISKENEVECIRCGQCADVCPSQLLPQELQWHAKANDHDKLNELNLFDCIECGACAYVCPSQIPLVQYYRVGKANIREAQVQNTKAEHAKSRFEARKIRLEKEKRAREEKHLRAAEARRAKMNAGTADGDNAKSAVAAALARVKAKKAQTTSSIPTTDEVNKAKDQTINTSAKSNESPLVDEQKSAQKSQVAAAVARAKAKKLAKQADAHPIKAPEPKIIKEIENKTEITSQEQTEEQTEQLAQQAKENSKKEKIAATIAKAKAKKATKKAEMDNAAQADATIEIETSVEKKKSTNATDEVSTNNTIDASEAKAKRIAAAVAKAKAKKQQRSESL